MTIMGAFLERVQKIRRLSDGSLEKLTSKTCPLCGYNVGRLDLFRDHLIDIHGEDEELDKYL